MTLNLALLAAAATAAMHVKNAAGEPLYSDGKPCRIVFYGPGTAQGAEVEARRQARALRRMQDNDGKITLPTREEQLAEQAEDLAALTVEFDNFDYAPAGDARGVGLFSAVYAEPSLGFIVKQGLKFQADWGNFKPAPSAG